MKTILLFFSFIIFLSPQNAQTKLSVTSKFKRHFHFKVNQFKSLPNTKDEIIFLGNSITAGGNWSELFKNIKMLNRGISGDITEGILYRLEEVTESKPSKIFLLIGINDLSKGLSVDSILINYRKIVDKIIKDSPGTEIYIQSVLPVNNNYDYFKNHTNKSDSVIILNNKLRKLSQFYNQTYIDLFSSFTNEEGKLKDNYTLDGLHLTGEGYWQWKTILDKYIN